MVEIEIADVHCHAQHPDKSRQGDRNKYHRLAKFAARFETEQLFSVHGRFGYVLLSHLPLSGGNELLDQLDSNCALLQGWRTTWVEGPAFAQMMGPGGGDRTRGPAVGHAGYEEFSEPHDRHGALSVAAAPVTPIDQRNTYYARTIRRIIGRSIANAWVVAIVLHIRETGLDTGFALDEFGGFNAGGGYTVPYRHRRRSPMLYIQF